MKLRLRVLSDEERLNRPEDTFIVCLKGGAALSLPRAAVLEYREDDEYFWIEVPIE